MPSTTTVQVDNGTVVDVRPGSIQTVVVTETGSSGGAVSVSAPPTEQVVTSSDQVVQVEELGLKGDPGPPGKDGKDGTDGTAVSFVYTQNTPVTITPTIAHGLGHYPQIEIVEAGTGQRVTLFDAIFPTLDTVIIMLLSPMAFTATMI